MQNSPDFYRTEISYRQDQIRRDWQPIRSRRTLRSTLKKVRRAS